MKASNIKKSIVTGLVAVNIMTVINPTEVYAAPQSDTYIESWGSEQKELVKYAVAKNNNQPVPLIMDLDMSGDTDDLIAMRIAETYDNEGLVDLKGVMLSENNSDNLASQAACGICDYYGFDDVSIGYTRALILEEESRYPYWNILAREAEPQKHSIGLAVNQYRKILANSPDHSVGIVITGYFDNISDLLKSGPDGYSPLTGVQLVAQKVKFFDVCGVGKGYSDKNYKAGFENNTCFYGTTHAGNFYRLIRQTGVPVYQYNENGHLAGTILVGGFKSLKDGDLVLECFRKVGRQHTGGPGWDAIATWALLPIIDGQFENYGINIQPYSVTETGSDDGYFESRPADENNPANVEIMDMTFDVNTYYALIEDAY